MKDTVPGRRNVVSIRERILVLSAVLPLLLVAFGCESSKQKVEVISGSKVSGEKTIRVASSDEAFVSFQRLTEQYAAGRGLHFEISQTQSKNIKALFDAGSIDIGVTARKLHVEEGWGELSYVPYAFDGSVFIVSEDAKVRSLTTAQIRDILEGRITNWKQVGGADAKINLITRPPYSSVNVALGKSLFQGEFPKVKSAFVLETAESAYQAMKSLNSYLAVAPLSRTITDHFPAVPVVVDGMEPLLSRVPFEKYPAKLEFGILFRKDAPGSVTDFANHLVSVDGMHQLASLGMVPSVKNLSVSSCHCRATEGTFNPTRKSELAGNFIIAVVPELGAIEQERRYAGISQVIAEEMGIRTQLKHLETYSRVVDEFKEGRIDAAFVGSFVYGMLHNRFGVLPIARPEKNGVSHYRGLIIVRENSGIRKISDLRGKSFAYVPRTSAGELYTSVLSGKKPEDIPRYFSSVVTPSSHSDVVNLVESGKIDGGAVKDLVLHRMFFTNPGLKNKIAILAQSGEFPDNALVVSPMISEKQKQKLLEILLSLDKKEQGREALKYLGADRFVLTSDAEFVNMYSMAGSAGYGFGK